MKFKKTLSTAGLVLAGGLMFAGSAGAAVSFLSTFDDGAIANNDGSWAGFATYAYSQGYTFVVPPSSGTHYAKTNGGSLSTTVDVTNGGLDTAAIAAGNMLFDFSTYLGSWTGNIDRAQVTYQFLDAGATPIGVATVFDDGLAGVPNGTWTQYSTTAGAVPTNAASVLISIDNSPSVGQAGTNDGYADLVSFSTSAIPEPSSLALLGLGGIALILRRRHK